MSRGRTVRSTEHGEYGYARRTSCQCDPCVTVRRQYAKQLAYDKYRGHQRQVDAQPVRDHVNLLIQAGGTIGMVAKATDGKVNRTQVRRILYGNPTTGRVVKTVYRHTAEALLAVTPAAMMQENGFVHPAGTHRRIQALAAMGHNKVAIAEAIGIQWSNLYEYLNQERVTTNVAMNIRTAYDKLSMTQGRSETIRWRARRLGWLPPLAWDESTIDDPFAEPELAGIKCVVATCSRSIVVAEGMLCGSHYRAVKEAGGFREPRRYRGAVLALAKQQVHNREALLDDIRELRSQGLDQHQVADRLGRGRTYIERLWGQAS